MSQEWAFVLAAWLVSAGVLGGQLIVAWHARKTTNPHQPTDTHQTTNQKPQKKHLKLLPPRGKTTMRQTSNREFLRGRLLSGKLFGGKLPRLGLFAWLGVGCFICGAGFLALILSKSLVFYVAPSEVVAGTARAGVVGGRAIRLGGWSSQTASKPQPTESSSQSPIYQAAPQILPWSLHLLRP